MSTQMLAKLIMLHAACFIMLLVSDKSTAQSNMSPPRQDSSSPTGVSYRSGALSMTAEDLSAAGGMPAGLSLSRTYNSAVINDGAGRSWAFNIESYVTIAALPTWPDDPPMPGREPYIYNVTFGGRSVGFLGGSAYQPGVSVTGGPVGVYAPSVPSGANLVFNGTNPNTGYYTFTDADGTIINFTSGPNGKASDWTMPDGTRLNYTYSGLRLRTITSNRGWALLFDGRTKACIVNTAQTYVTSSSSCPSDAQAVTYVLGPGVFNTAPNLLKEVTKAGATTTYQYSSKDHLDCVKNPGQAVCQMQTSWGDCADDPSIPGLQFDLHMHDYVTSQQDASGKAYEYTYIYLDTPDATYPVSCPKWQEDANPDYRPFSRMRTTMTEAASATTTITVDRGGLPREIGDPLGRVTYIGLQSFSGPNGYPLPDTEVTDVVLPEGNYDHFARDGRANLVAKTTHPKTGAGTFTTSANYPSSCANPKTCNKPTSATDAKGSQTDFTYDAAHGGVSTETLPADANGIRAQKRYGYVQRYAWLKNAGGTFNQAATPVWLLDTMKTCRTTATVSGACAGGGADEVVTAYDYGPNTGAVGNNLLLRGVTVTADGTTLRTCYGYDVNGNRIWETKPRAGLASCY